MMMPDIDIVVLDLKTKSLRVYGWFFEITRL